MVGGRHSKTEDSREAEGGGREGVLCVCDTRGDCKDGGGKQDCLSRLSVSKSELELAFRVLASELIWRSTVRSKFRGLCTSAGERASGLVGVACPLPLSESSLTTDSLEDRGRGRGWGPAFEAWE